jgi:putative membrane protein
MPLENFPTLNACLNGLSAVFLLVGFLFIRRGDIRKHTICMVGALVCSALFLTCYLYYHAHAGSTKFPYDGALRFVYLWIILLPHTILATAVLPFILWIVALAIKSNFQKHKKIARYVFPVWLYVGVSGVVVYLMLYQLPKFLPPPVAG